MLPKEFVLYTDHQALRYLSTQSKLNQWHMKWVEFLQGYMFMLRHRSGKSNKVADALSKRVALLNTTTIQAIGIE